MIAPAVLAQACSDIYADAPAGFDNLWDFGGCHAGRREVEGSSVIVFRGSKDTQDWIRDVEAVPVWDYALGFVHGGFLAGVRDVLGAVVSTAGKSIVVTGHSLGGARARILAALMAYSGQPVKQCCVFGSPRPGFANLARILVKSGTPLASYRNRNDPVPLVPFMAGLYEHPDEWVKLDAPAPTVELDPLRDHHCSLYIDGLKRLVA